MCSFFFTSPTLSPLVIFNFFSLLLLCLSFLVLRHPLTHPNPPNHPQEPRACEHLKKELGGHNRAIFQEPEVAEVEE